MRDWGRSSSRTEYDAGRITARITGGRSYKVDDAGLFIEAVFTFALPIETTETVEGVIKFRAV